MRLALAERQAQHQMIQREESGWASRAAGPSLKVNGGHGSHGHAHRHRAAEGWTRAQIPVQGSARVAARRHPELAGWSNGDPRVPAF